MEQIIYNLALGLPGLLMAVVFHEAAHAFMAYKFGDLTPKHAGRLTLNPLPHIDLIGTILFPVIGAVLGGIMFGWARPVPIDVRSFRNIRKAVFWVSFAGPGMNLVLALISAFFLSIVQMKFSPDFYLYGPLIKIFEQAVYINTVLAVFNLIPFPPLDGSKMLLSVLSYEVGRKFETLERYSLFFFLFLMVTGVGRFIFLPALLFSQTAISVFSYLLS